MQKCPKNRRCKRSRRKVRSRKRPRKFRTEGEDRNEILRRARVQRALPELISLLLSNQVVLSPGEGAWEDLAALKFIDRFPTSRDPRMAKQLEDERARRVASLLEHLKNPKVALAAWEALKNRLDARFTKTKDKEGEVVSVEAGVVETEQNKNARSSTSHRLRLDLPKLAADVERGEEGLTKLIGAGLPGRLPLRRRSTPEATISS